MKNSHYIVGPYLPSSSDLYDMQCKYVSQCAKDMNRELAEGPTILIQDNHPMSVELWPLVREENDVISR